MKKHLTLILLLFLVSQSWAQQNVEQPKSKRLTIGIEQDVLPYVLNGYIGTVWLGRDYQIQTFLR